MIKRHNTLVEAHSSLFNYDFDPVRNILLFDSIPCIHADGHSHKDCYQITFVFQGKLKVQCNNDEFIVEKNHILIIPPDVSHWIFALDTTPYLYRQLSADIVNSTSNRQLYSILESTFKNHYACIEVTPPSKSFSQIVNNLKKMTPFAVNQTINILENLIFEAIETYTTTQKKKKINLQEIIAENKPEILSVQRLMDITNYSRSQLERISKDELGCNLKDYLIKFKIIKICSYLTETNMTIEEIAEKMEMCDSSHLVTLFKRNMGITPGQYRRNNRL
ncbi:MAG: helix-turn-helix domain-containing protein [Ruminococcaceae bacterium]|nr:helix-turn-helix domain-containing protein [Oscillospiraceae bacterium]